MLKMMRDNFQHLKWALLAVVAAFIVGFVYVDMGLGGAGQSQGEDRAYAARVNGETIPYREYDRALYYTQKNYEQMYKQPMTDDMIRAMGLPQQVLDSLIDQRLLLQQARRLHLGATPQEIRQEILQIPTLNPDGHFVGDELYTRYITASLGYQSPAEFENELGREITLKKIESAMQNSIVISPKAAEAEYRRVSENAKIRYILYPAARADNVTVTPAEVDQYYKQNEARYAHGEQRELKYLVADINRLRSQIVPTDAQLEKRYEDSKEDYKQPESAHILHILIKVDPNATAAEDAVAKAKADKLVAELRAGADFAKLARENSGDPSSAAKGGDMGFVPRGMTVEAFDKAAFSIPLNTISDPIRSREFGYHIIKVLERRPAGYRSFAEVKAMLAAQVADQMAKDRARDEITQVAARIKQAKPTTPAQFSALANDTVSSNDTQWFGKSDSIPGLGNNNALITWAFAAKQGDIGDIVGTQRGPAIPYLFAIRPAGIPPLSEIRPRVEADARVAKQREVARETLARAMPAANIDELAKKAGLTATETTVTRQGFISGFTGDTSALIDAAMSAKVGDVKGPIVLPEGAVVFQVLDQKKVDQKDIEANRAAYAEMLRQQEARNLRTVLLERLRKESTIDINPIVNEQKAPQQQRAGL
ncbi:MAG TPA: peptidyl-prolyl cis-trans isomerase [Thermoanaerobaculia bacterium]|nr:peptidyl-prolyl cis-trans isomerase [Thermoanaerobaculia bacterium]